MDSFYCPIPAFVYHQLLAVLQQPSFLVYHMSSDWKIICLVNALFQCLYYVMTVHLLHQCDILASCIDVTHPSLFYPAACSISLGYVGWVTHASCSSTLLH